MCSRCSSKRIGSRDGSRLSVVIVTCSATRDGLTDEEVNARIEKVQTRFSASPLSP